MRTLPIVSGLVFLAACGSKSGPTIDQKGPFLFRLDGKQTVVENVEWGKTEERNGMAGRIENGKRIPGITGGTFATRPFQVDGRTVSIDLAFDMGTRTGGIKIDDKVCEFDGGQYFQGGGGTVAKVRYRGFQGTCKLDGKELEFVFGPVTGADRDE